jgi:hypothetical protein
MHMAYVGAAIEGIGTGGVVKEKPKAMYFSSTRRR